MIHVFHFLFSEIFDFRTKASKHSNSIQTLNSLHFTDIVLPSMRAYSLKIENCRVISEWKSLAGSRCTLEDFGATEGKLKEVNIQPSKSRFRAVIICDSCLPTDNARDFLSSRTPSTAIASMEIRISLSVPRNHVKILSRCRELAFSLRSLKLAQFFCAINFPIKRR